MRNRQQSLGHSVRSLLRSKLLQVSALCVVLVAMMGAGTSRYDRLGHEMICTCGCSQILMECNHVGCPVSPVMLKELQEQMAAGKGDTEILNWFAAKYGAIVLAAPIRGGFDDVAWIMPIAVFLLATVGTGVLIWVWHRRSLRLAAASQPFPCGGVLDDDPQQFPAERESPEASAMRERIRKETEYR
jgi:cytochrome c-type biogenesis protein CcmH